MNYYLIFLLDGKVVDICTYADEESRQSYIKYIEQYNLTKINDREFDQIQILDIVR